MPYFRSIRHKRKWKWRFAISTSACAELIWKRYRTTERTEILPQICTVIQLENATRFSQRAFFLLITLIYNTSLVYIIDRMTFSHENDFQCIHLLRLFIENINMNALKYGYTWNVVNNLTDIWGKNRFFGCHATIT